MIKELVREFLDIDGSSRRQPESRSV